MNRSIPVLGLLAIAVVGSVSTASAASDHSSLLPNLDVREQPKVDPVAPLRTAQLDESLGMFGFADTDPRTGGVAFVGRTDRFLTGSSKNEPADIVLDYVRSKRAAFGLDSADLAGLELTDSYTSTDGVTHVTYSQVVDGIASFDTFVRGNVTADGELINISGSPMPDLSIPSMPPALTADEALLAARENVGGDDSLPEVTKRGGGPERKTTYATYAESAWLTVFAQEGKDRLAWHVQVLDGDDLLYRVIVDAATGEILVRQSMTAFDSNDAQIWPTFPSKLVAPTQVNFGTDPSWLDRSPANLNQLIGNNTHTYVDNNGTNGYQVGEQVVRNPGTTNWKYPMTWWAHDECPAFGCTWDSTNAATKLTNRNPGAVSLFYLTNRFHDHLLQAPIGFNEASRNFEFVNATGLGVGNDAVLAEAQDSAGLNNANFATPADGSPPRMQMYLWSGNGTGNGPRYDVDGSAAADIVYHEYGHGLSNRLVGNGAGLTTNQAQAMGEGWSDFYAMDFLVHEGHVADGAAADVWLGDYAPGVPGIFGGISRIRHQAIDCPVGGPAVQCPASASAGSGGYTFGDLGGVGTNNGEHDNGEIWSQTMWDLRKELGRTDALKIITGGMRLSPNAPSMLTMRDSILQSALVNGVNTRRVWKVFAGRGMGYFASTPSANQFVSTEDFTALDPLVHVVTTVDDSAPGGNGNGFADPGEILDINASVRNVTGAPVSGATATMTAGAGVEVVRPSTSWPTVNPGQTAFATSPMTAVVPAIGQCGADVPVDIVLSQPAGEQNLRTRVVQLGAPSFLGSTDVPKVIPDNNASGVSSIVTTPGAGPAKSPIVRIGRINHTWVGDLTITLTHDGVMVKLFEELNGGNASLDNIVNMTFDDRATVSARDAVFDATVPGYTGTYRPLQSLSAFDGRTLAGPWTLKIVDAGFGDSGTLQAWSISPRPVCDAFASPVSQTGAASAVGPTSATLNGLHNSSGNATDYRFEWGTSTAYGQQTPVTAGGAGASAVPVAASLAGLTQGTPYHFRLIAMRDGVVLSRGADQVFTTSVPAVADTTPPGVQVTKAPKKKVKTKKAKVKVSVQFTSEAGAAFTCKLNKGAAKACSSPFKAKVKAKRGKGKKHVIVVVARDATGNVSPPATVTFRAVRKR